MSSPIFRVLVSGLSVYAALSAAAVAAESSAVLQRIEHVQNGLRMPVAIQGQPPAPMTLAERMAAWRVPGVGIAVINNGAIEWARGYGVADANSREPVTTSTLFQAASISKPVAAAAALRLVEQGKLGLDENVNTRLVSWKVPENEFTASQPVTLRRLLSHTAGLPPGGVPGYAADGKIPSLPESLAGLPPANTRPVRVGAVPGTRFGYASQGYSVMQMLVSDAAGVPFPELMKRTVLDPVGMNQSSFEQPVSPALARLAASGHDTAGGALAGKWRVHPEQAAAGLWTTPSDLARFAIELQRSAQGKSDRLLSQAMSAQMMTPVLGSYGLGLETNRSGAEPSFAHSGSNAGFKTQMFAYTRSGKGAVVMTNGDNGGALMAEIMRSIAAEYGWSDYLVTERKAVAPNAALFDKFAGTFKVSGTTLKFSRDGDRLFVEGPPVGPVKVELFPASEYTFFLKEKDATIAFQKNGDGPVDEITVFDGQPRQGVRATP